MSARVRRSRPARARRGAALLLVILMTGAFAALALGAIHLSGTATLVTRAYEREQEFKYAAEAAVAVGKSRLNHDPFALPDTGFTALLTGQRIDAADGQPVPGLTVNVYAGPSGSTTGQFGRFASVVAEARDGRGARFVRRLELTQESFARFAYWTNVERQPNGGPIVFIGGDQVFGPVWSNDDIQISTANGSGPVFWDEVGTARTVVNRAGATFRRGPPLERQDRIELPNNTRLARLPGFAAAGGLSFNAATNGDATSIRTRLEFVAHDLNGDGDREDPDEGWLRVYTAGASALPGGTPAADWLRGDRSQYNCGDWHLVDGDWRFFPAAIHRDTRYHTNWAAAVPAAHRNVGGVEGDMASGAGAVPTLLGVEFGRTDARYREPGSPTPRCFLGGDPRLAPVERTGNGFPDNGRKFVGGDDTTFTRVGRFGTWAARTGTAYAPLAARATLPAASPRRLNADEVAALHPITRAANPATMGVVYVRGSAGLSGTLRGRVTVYSDANLVLLDDQRYATDPAATDPARQAGRCADVLGILAARDVVVADNALNTPQATAASTPIPGVPAGIRSADETPDVFVHGVVMALNQSFFVENWGGAPVNGQPCEGATAGRGCLYLTGGLIQERRGAVGTTGGGGANITGFLKRYAYDRCAAVQPPPYFPTTGRFLDNRYSELDPVGFDPGRYFASITPRPL